MSIASTNCQYLIIAASWRDLNAVRHVEQMCFPQDAWPLLDVISVLTLPNVVRLKAMCRQQLIGFVAGDVRRSEGISWIATIGVLPEYRGQGIGRDLLQSCEARLLTPFIRLCVRPNNHAAIKLYESTGYSMVNRWPDYYLDGEDALVLEKVRQSGL